MGRDPNRDRQRREQTRRALLAAGRELLAAGAPARITVRKVAARAGVSVGTFYVYFDDLPELLREVVRDALAEARPRIAATRGIRDGTVARDPARAVARSFAVFFDLIDESPELARLLLARRSAPGPEGALVRAEVQEYVADLAEDLQRAQAAGWVASEVDPGLAAEAIVEMTLSVARRYAAAAEERQEQPVLRRRAISTLARLALRGVAHDEFLAHLLGGGTERSSGRVRGQRPARGRR